MIHPSHKTEYIDASSFDEICIRCGAKDGIKISDSLSKSCPKQPWWERKELNHYGKK